MWESSTPAADAAYEQLMESVVDFNELRVCLPHELVAAIGPRYPRALERCQRLKAVLNDLYRREHAVTFERLSSGGKREVRKYIESLEGMVPYVATRLLLLCFEMHGVPLDEQLRALLIQEGAADPSVEVPELSPWLSRHVKSGRGASAHAALQQWVDDVNARIESGGAGPRRRTRPRRKSTRRTSSAQRAKKAAT
jgi:hypothetical protein